MARSPNSFHRTPSRYRPQPTVLVICEDSKSGKRYLEAASRHFRCIVQVRITHCGKTDPKGIVYEAISSQRKFERVFCVIDRDNHTNFSEALDLAKTAPNVTIIASYPCFEYWLLLHFSCCRKPYASTGSHSAADLLIRDLRACSGMEGYAKGSEQDIFLFLLGDKLSFARATAKRILAEAVDDGEMNPSTSLHQLIDYLEKLPNLETI